MAEEKEDTEPTEKSLAFGPMPPAKRVVAQPQASSLSDADIQRLAAAMVRAQGGAVAEPEAQPNISEEDQRVHDALSRVHSSARNFAVTSRLQVGYDLYLVRVSYKLATGAARQEASYLVYDDGKGVTVFQAS